MKTAVWGQLGQILRSALILLRRGGFRLLGLLLLSQLTVLAVALPVLQWLFKEALRANGMNALDLGGVSSTAGLPLTFGLIFLLCAVAFWLMCLQFTVLVVFLNAHDGGSRPTAGLLAREVVRVAFKLLRPSSLPLVSYLLLLLPLTGFGFTSALVQGVSIPHFISGELQKSTLTAVLFGVFLALLGFINNRLALTVPLFVLTDATGHRAVAGSWRMLGGIRGLWVALAVAAGLLTAGILSSVLLYVMAVPTTITDALAPAASPIVASYSLGIAQVAGLCLSGLLTAFVAAVVVGEARRSTDSLPAGISFHPVPAASATVGSRRPAAVVLSGAVILALLLGTAGIGTLTRLAAYPETLVLAHRGFSQGGVENTIAGLEAAAEAGADLVEIDVMQSKDHEFVVLHDPNLARLTGQALAVKDLTRAELSALTVHDSTGRREEIPTLESYIRRAQELDMPLLIEIKLSGAEQADHVAQLVAELESLGALEANMYHSLDKPSVETLKRLRPDLTVGYILAFAGIDAPQTSADFLVVEEFTATRNMQEAAERAGLGFVVWTVNGSDEQQRYLRADVDGIITDRPDTALTLRAAIQDETGLAGTLRDALKRFVVVL